MTLAAMKNDEILPFVRRIARTVQARARHADYDDLVGAGCLGLLDAMTRYDPSRGAAFTTFADRRVRGAMLDYMRGEDPLSRHGRKKVKRGEQDPPTVAPLTEAEDLPSPPVDMVSYIWARELFRHATFARDRHVIVQLFWRDKDGIDVAHEAGVGGSAISHHKTRALRQMREAA